MTGEYITQAQLLLQYYSALGQLIAEDRLSGSRVGTGSVTAGKTGTNTLRVPEALTLPHGLSQHAPL